MDIYLRYKALGHLASAYFSSFLSGPPLILRGSSVHHIQPCHGALTAVHSRAPQGWEPCPPEIPAEAYAEYRVVSPSKPRAPCSGFLTPVPSSSCLWPNR